jgi:hypothetical protein
MTKYDLELRIPDAFGDESGWICNEDAYLDNTITVTNLTITSSSNSQPKQLENE